MRRKRLGRRASVALPSAATPLLPNPHPRSRKPRFVLYVIERLEPRMLLSAVSWTGAADDNQWTTPGNWSTNALPGPADDVTINLGANPTIQLSSGIQSVHSVSTTDPLQITGGTLQVATTLQSSATVTLAGGTIQGATITETGGAILALTSGTLAGDTVVAGTTATTTGLSNINVAGGLTLNGTLDLGAADGSSYASIFFTGTQTLSGTGTVQLGASINNTIYSEGDGGSNPATLTIGSGILVTGGGGSLTGYRTGDSIVNAGTINGNVAGATIGLSGNYRGGGSTFINESLVEETAAGTVDIGASAGNIGLTSPWTNSGTLSVSNGGKLNLYGSFTTAAIGAVTNTGGTVDLAGILNNAGATLALNSTTGGWNLAGGIIDGGTITDTSSDPLTFASGISFSPNTLSGVTIAVGSVLNGTVGNDLQFGEITNGLTLNGAIDVGSADGSTALVLVFFGPQTISGTGTIVFGGSPSNQFRAQSADGGVTPAVLTFASGITIQGGSGTITSEYSIDSVILQGAIYNTTTGTFILDASNLVNEGTITSQNGSTIDIEGSGWSNTGTFNVSPSGTLNLEGTFTTAAIGSVINGGGTVNLAGVLNNTGATLALNSITGGWNLAGGTIDGGMVTDTSSDLLTFGLPVVFPSSTLSGVTIPAGSTLNGTVGNDLRSAEITNGLTLNGTLDVGSTDGNTALQLIFFGTQTLSGSGTIVFGGSPSNQFRAQSADGGVTGATLTIASGISIQGGGGEITAEYPIDSFINLTTITLTTGATFTISADNWINKGTISYDGLGSLVLDGTAWSNQGTVKALDGTSLSLEGFDYTLPGMVDAATGVVYILGTLNNAGATLSLNSNTGNWFVGNNAFPGAISGGTVATAGSAVLGVAQAGGTLAGVTLAGTVAVKPVFLANIDPLIVTGGLTLNSGTITINGPSSVKFEGTQTLGGSGSVILSGVASGFGMLIPNPGDVLTIGAGVTVQGDSGQVGSAGGGTLTNQGTIEAFNGGALLVQNYTNFSGGTLTGGTWGAINNSTLDLPAANVVTSAAGLLLDGASSLIESNTTGTNSLAGLTTITATGALTIQNGANFSSAASFNNAGAVTVGSGSTLAVGGAGVYTQSGGSTILKSGTLGIAGNQVNINGGTLSGPGAIIGNLTNAGEVDLGANPGVLTINGNYNQTASGTLTVKVAGATAGTQFDQINVSGTASLGGTLTASLGKGFAPALEESFAVLNFTSSSGNFATFNSPSIGGFAVFVTNSMATSLDLVGATSAPDLAVASVSVSPSSATVGQKITISCTVDNLGTVATAAGSWTDSVYLSSSASLTSAATLLGRISHTGNVPGLSSYMDTLTASVPGVSQGNFSVIVVADSGKMVPDVNRANNQADSATPLMVGTPPLTLGSPAMGTIVKGQKIYYRLDVAPGANVQVQATYKVANESKFLIRYDALPTTSSFDESVTDLTALDPVLMLPSGQGGAYYILLIGQSGAATPQAFTLLANVVPFALTSFDTPSASNTGNVTMHISGSGFTAQTTLSLTSGSTVVTPQTTTFINANELIATFDLVGQPTGSYVLKAVDGSQSSTAPKTFQVVAASSTQDLQVIADCPPGGLPGIPLYLFAYVRNVGETDIQIPVFDLVGTDVNGFTKIVMSFGGGTLAPGEVIGPETDGEIGQVRFLPFPQDPGTTTTWSLGAVPPATTIDWATFAAATPPDVPAAGWKAVVANLQANLGDTVTSMNNAFQADSIYLAQVGDSVTSQQALFGFELLKATDGLPSATLAGVTDTSTVEAGLALDFERTYSQSLVSRYTPDSLGYGWTSNWNITATTDPNNGNVYIQEGAVSREFVQLSPGVYAGADGDTGTLTLSGGSYALRETDGSLTSFLPDGQFAYIQNSDGARLTAAYNNGLLTSVSAPDGDQLTFAYNGQNLLSSVTDPAGNVTTYTYNSNSELTGVSNNLGTYQYTYVTPSSPQTGHDLASATNPDGTHVYFTYDSQGRLTGQSGDGGTGALTYAYLSPAGYTITNAAGQTTTILYNVNGQTAMEKDPQGNVTQVTYNANGQVIQATHPGGVTSSSTYDAIGRITTSVDPLGNATQYSYNSAGNLVGVQDPNGNTTALAYDAKTELTSVTQPDGTAASYVYNAQGAISESIDALGRVTHYTYDGNGRLTLRLNPDGSSIAYTYDSARDLTSVTDSSGTITMTYDSAHELTGITYPNGQYLQYTYAPGGILTQTIDQTGFTENYHYNSAGQLVSVTDASGAALVTYTYDLVGRLSSATNGNGTYTTYTYDSDGNLIDLINYAPGATINSRFDYIYNALGLVTSVSTLVGTTNYTYDADGQVTSVALPSGETITYAYDATGNRTTVTDSGGPTTSYTSNNLNQYTAVGGYTYTYDANGNLTVSGGPSGNTTNTYDPENRLIELQTPTDTYTYQYNALNALVYSTDNAQVTNYLINPMGNGSVDAEFDGSGKLIANFAYGLGLVGQITASGGREYYDYDAVGSTVGITGSTGSYLNTYTYLPFGELKATAGTAPNPFQYEGKLGVMVGGGGLYYMRARFYSPTTGRFINRDPTGLASGTNLYKFAGNNPVSAVDPTGLGYYSLLTPQQQIQVQNYLADLRQNFINDCALGGITPTADDLAAIGDADKIAGAILNDPDSGAAFNFGEAMHDLVNADTIVASLETDATIVDANLPTALAVTISAGAVTTAATSSTTLAALGTIATFVGGAIVEVLPPVFFITLAGVLIYESYELYNELNVPISNSATATATCSCTLVGPHDPNYISGPGGFGGQGYVPGASPLSYTVGFENEASASAPAHVVQVTEQLDANLDWTTFQLGQFGYGGQTFAVPPGLTSYTTLIDDTATLGVDVQVDAEFDVVTGELTWTFTTIDPTTLDDPVGNAFEGFLPPNVTPPQGEGFVSYTVQPKGADTTGTSISAQATVIFDAGLPDQSPLDTTSISNTIDSGAPTSSVLALPAVEATPAFTVSWSGSDDPGGSGIANYNIYVSDNGGPFKVWLSNTNLTSAAYTGTNHHTYAFYSQATDNVGNQETAHAAPDAQTKVVVLTPQVTAETFAYQKQPYTLAFTFNENVSASLSLSVIRIVNLATGNPVVPTGMSYDPSTNTATFTLPAEMPDGNYQARLLASAITDASGNHLDGLANGMAADFFYNFFALTGDVNHDRAVNFADLVILAQNYGKPGTFAAGDLNGDGTVDFADLVILAQDYGHGLAVPPSPDAVEVDAAAYADSPMQSLSFTFSSDVSGSISAAALSVVNTTTGTNVSPMSFSFNAASNTATFLFDGTLANGRYQATLSAAAVVDSSGNHLDGLGDGVPGTNYVFNFNSLVGDVNGDGTVNFADLVTLAQNYGKAGSYSQGDLNGDGTVNFSDLVILAQNYGSTVLATGGQAVRGMAASALQVSMDVDAASVTQTGVPAILSKRRRPAGHASTRRLRRLAEVELLPGHDIVQLERQRGIGLAKHLAEAGADREKLG